MENNIDNTTDGPDNPLDTQEVETDYEDVTVEPGGSGVALFKGITFLFILAAICAWISKH